LRRSLTNSPQLAHIDPGRTAVDERDEGWRRRATWEPPFGAGRRAHRRFSLCRCEDDLSWCEDDVATAAKEAMTAE